MTEETKVVEEKAAEVETEVVPEDDVKVVVVKEKLPLRKRIGQKLVSDEPLIPKKVKIVGGAIVAALGVAAGVAIKVMSGHDGVETVDALPGPDESEGVIRVLQEAEDGLFQDMDTGGIVKLEDIGD